MPQWNCACSNCVAARAGSIPARTQSSVAFSADGAHWFLVNASPDIRAQLAAFPPLHPAASPVRNTSLQAVLITNADLDHVAGLIFLREGSPLHLHAAPAVQHYLSHPLAITPLLTAFCGVVWQEPPLGGWAALDLSNGSPSGLTYRALLLPSPPPVFGPSNGHAEQTMAFLIRDERTEKVMLIAPDVFEITAELQAAMDGADAVLFDGTFWSEQELIEVKPAGRLASAMGHLPIRDGSLDLLARCRARHRIYLHINNTNPILQPASEERHAVESAGLVVGWDGLEFEL